MKGILFKPEMIQAIIEGRKTQTRRVIKPQPPEGASVWRIENGNTGKGYFSVRRCSPWYTIKPRYQVGEVVYVKEAWATEKRYDNLKPSEIPHTAKIFYVSDGVGEWPTNLSIGRLRSPLHLTEEFARYFIKITGVRAERLQEISQVDVFAEGFGDESTGAKLRLFTDTWDSINPKYPWEMNPWAWVYSFEKV